MLWIIYKEYFNKCTKTSSYIRNLNWYEWVIFLFMMTLTIALYFAYIYFDLFLLLVATSIMGLSGAIYFGNELKKKVKKEIGDFEDLYEKNIFTLRQLLKKRKVYSSSQVDFLLKQIDEELPELKISEGIFKTFYTIGTVIIIPIVTMIIKWILDKYSYGYFIAMQLILLLIMIISLFNMETFY